MSFRKLSFRKVCIILFATFVSIVLLWLFIGFLSSYIGYYGYNKHKARRFSKNKMESLSRKVFIKDACFFTKREIRINSVFIESAYKWGHNSDQTKILNRKDVYPNNNVDSLFQIVVEFNEKQDLNHITIGEYRKCLQSADLTDTLKYQIYIRDTSYNLVSIDTLCVFSCPEHKP